MSYYDQRANYARDAAFLCYGYRRHNTIHEAIGVYMHLVILGMDLGLQALGYIHLTNLTQL